MGQPSTSPPIGTLAVPPAAYLMLTKHCGLIYRITHWHKNLEDLYYLRDRIPTVPEEVAALLPDCLADSRRMFAQSHLRGASNALGCHPQTPPLPDPHTHSLLHQLLAVHGSPMVTLPRAWDGFPESPPCERRDAMIDLLAEEAMVVAAERSIGEIYTPGDPSTWIRFALRELSVGPLPEAWRYFVVNYYREIRSRVPDDWVVKLDSLPSEARRRLPCRCAEPNCSGRARDGARSHGDRRDPAG